MHVLQVLTLNTAMTDPVCTCDLLNVCAHVQDRLRACDLLCVWDQLHARDLLHVWYIAEASVGVFFPHSPHL